MRFVISGGAPLDPEVQKGFNNFGIRMVQGYGLTETSPVICAENDFKTRNGSIGVQFIIKMKLKKNMVIFQKKKLEILFGIKLKTMSILLFLDINIL